MRADGPKYVEAVDFEVSATKLANSGTHLKLWQLLRGCDIEVPAGKLTSTAKLFTQAVHGKGKVTSLRPVPGSTANDIARALSKALGIDIDPITTEAEQSSEAAAAAAKLVDHDILTRASGTCRQFQDSVVLRCHAATDVSTEPTQTRVLKTLEALLSMVRAELTAASSPANFAERVPTALKECEGIASFVAPIGYKPTASCLTRLCEQNCPAALLGRKIGTRLPHVVTVGHGCGHSATVGMCTQCAPKQGPSLKALQVSEAAPHPLSSSIIWEEGGLGHTGVHWGNWGVLGHSSAQLKYDMGAHDVGVCTRCRGIRHRGTRHWGTRCRGTAHDVRVCDTGAYDTGVHDVGAYDIGVYDMGAHDVGAHDVGAHDIGACDVGACDVGVN